MGRYKIVFALLLLPLLFSVLFESTLLAESSSNTSNDDWSMFHHDASNAGFTNGSAPISVPDEVWRYGDTDSSEQYKGSPAVVNGVVYVADVSLSALNASTGELLWWQYDQGYSSPVVDNGIVYTNKGAFNASTGNQLWAINGTFCAVVANGYYYTNYQDPSNNNTYFIGVNATTRDIIWKSSGTVVASPAIVNGKIFAPSSPVSALDAYTGHKIWDSEEGVTAWFPPVFSDNLVYASAEGGSLYCIDASSGKTVWNQTVGGLGSPTAPAVAYGLVYVGSEDGNVYAFNAYSGEEKWVSTLEASHGQGFSVKYQVRLHGVESSPVAASGAVYVGADDGNLYAINATTGANLWSYKLGEPQQLRCSPALANGYIYMGSSGLFVTSLGLSQVGRTQSNTDLTYIVIISCIVVIICVALLIYKKL
jgi:eukaryotic-like serine/threonine-protein kinase